MTAGRSERVELASIPLRERWAVYWGCYWRSVVFVVGHVAVTAAIFVATTAAAARHWGPERDPALIAIVTTEVCSAVVGFCSVALFVHHILGRRLGGFRLALLVEREAGSGSRNASE